MNIGVVVSCSLLSQPKHPGLTCLVLVGVVIGSLIPDVDNQESLLGRFMRRLNRLQHRGITHTVYGLCFWLIICWLFSLLSKALAIGLFVGYLLHLLEDSWSVEGIRWWSYGPLGHYDQVVYARYGRFIRPVDHFEVSPYGKSIPCRHQWGRGYKVGGRLEKIISHIFLIADIGLLFVLLFKFFQK